MTNSTINNAVNAWIEDRFNTVYRCEKCSILWYYRNLEYRTCYKYVEFIFNKTTFNDDITGWDTSNVTNMSYMFAGSSIFNQDIGIWNVFQVINMAYMFAAASEFDQNIGIWNVGKVTNMDSMFVDAINSINI